MPGKKTNILGVNIDNVTRTQALDMLFTRLVGEKRGFIVFTPNPEMVIEARKDANFKKMLNAAGMVVPDGIGIVIASVLYKNKIKERVAGCDLFDELMKQKGREMSVYLLGANPGVAVKAAENLRMKYGVRITGARDGYFNEETENIIIDEIKKTAPDLLICGLGMVKQTEWLYRNRDLPVKIMAGLGGSIDIYAGTVKRAPLFMRKLGLEWLARLIREPKRFFRMLRLPLFLFYVVGDRMLFLIKKK